MQTNNIVLQSSTVVALKIIQDGNLKHKEFKCLQLFAKKYLTCEGCWRRGYISLKYNIVKQAKLTPQSVHYYGTLDPLMIIINYKLVSCSKLVVDTILIKY